ncbi:MAG: hypothetical protein HY699_24625 [Deltaproteobacteria bacterium]|nr:hypothetical protein [Deltaproteobacteria bacterium]
MSGGAGQAGTWWQRQRVLPVLHVALFGAVLIASYLHADWTSNDFERFDDLRLTVLFLVLFLGLSAAHLALYIGPVALSRGCAFTVVLLGAGMLFASFPVGSRDVFAYAFFSKIWAYYHANPFIVAGTQFPADSWQPYLGRALARPVAAYGPLFMWQSWPVGIIAGERLWVAVWLHKAWAGLALLGSLGIAAALLRRSQPAAPAGGAWLLLAWNPALLFEAAGAAHNDIGMVLLLLAALWCWQRERGSAALACLALSFWYKWYSVLFVPAFLLATTRAAGVRAAARQAAFGALVTAALGWLLLKPLAGALPMIARQLLHPEKLSGIFPAELSPPLALLFWAMRAAGGFDSDWGFRLFDVGRFGLSAALLLAIGARQWRAAPSLAALAESCCLIGLVFCSLMVTQLWPWHLLPVITLALVCGREPFTLVAVVLTVLALLSYALTFAIAALTLGGVAGSLWLLRRWRPAT